MVTITLRVMSRPDVQHLPRIYQTLGLDYDERVLPSIGNEVLKSIVAQFDAAELITQREVVCRLCGADWNTALKYYRFRHAFARICYRERENSISFSRMSR